MTQAVATAETFSDRLAAFDGSAPGEPELLTRLRQAARASLAEQGLPTPRRESWRFTNLKRQAAIDYEPAPAAQAPDLDHLILPEAHVVVMVNGRVQPELSRLDDTPSGLTIGSLASAASAQPERLAGLLGRHLAPEDHPFAALNTTAFTDGLFIELAAGTHVERPIQVVCLSVGGDRPALVTPRMLVVAGKGCEAALVEQYASTGNDTLTVPVTELVVEANAVLRHVRLQEENRESDHIAVQQVTVDRDGLLESVAVNLGARLFRADVDGVLVGEGAHASLDGLYLVEGSQHTDTQMKVRHAVPHCTSHELYKGILDGGARSVFNGRIVVDPGAQKTDAVQSNRNLLLSDGALAFSNPQLEIFADDVRCTHGSTVGRLDEDAVFYLRSRGLDRQAAESLLTWAFASEVVQKITVDAVRERLEGFLFERLPQGDVVQEAV